MASTMTTTTNTFKSLAPAVAVTAPPVRTELNTFARLELAAALLEYDQEEDGKVAQQSAIFAPYHQNASYVNDDVALSIKQAYQNRYSSTFDNVDHDGHYDGIKSTAGTPMPSLYGDFLGSDDLRGNAEDEKVADDADLISEWGLETVMSKFGEDSHDSTLRRKKHKPSRSTAQSEIVNFSSMQPLETYGRLGSSASKARSLPDVLDYTTVHMELDLLPDIHQKKFEILPSTSSMLTPQHAERPRSQSSSVGLAPSLFSADAMRDSAADAAKSYAAYTQEACARPVSSMSGMTSRFDPKAMAAVQTEELSERLRFPKSINPKILVMPAPLFDLAEHRQSYDVGNTSINPVVESVKLLRTAREPGRLYGKSLMDELNVRKQRQKLKQRVFQGDNRIAMMDSLVSQAHRQAKGPSPLSGKLSGDEKDGIDDQEPQVKETNLPIADTWAKYVSNNTRDGKGNASASVIQYKLPSLESGQIHPLPSTDMLQAPLSSQEKFPSSMSTKELQQQYRQSRKDFSFPLQKETLADSDTDDDVPLLDRHYDRTNSTSAHASQAIVALPSLPSVFGRDLIMERELAKLEEILKIEEAEKKIVAEQQRVRLAEHQAKEKRKQEKTDKHKKTKDSHEYDMARNMRQEEAGDGEPVNSEVSVHLQQVSACWSIS